MLLSSSSRTWQLALGPWGLCASKMGWTESQRDSHKTPICDPPIFNNFFKKPSSTRAMIQSGFPSYQPANFTIPNMTSFTWSIRKPSWIMALTVLGCPSLTWTIAACLKWISIGIPLSELNNWKTSLFYDIFFWGAHYFDPKGWASLDQACSVLSQPISLKRPFLKQTQCLATWLRAAKSSDIRSKESKVFRYCSFNSYSKLVQNLSTYLQGRGQLTLSLFSSLPDSLQSHTIFG